MIIEKSDGDSHLLHISHFNRTKTELFSLLGVISMLFFQHLFLFICLIITKRGSSVS